MSTGEKHLHGDRSAYLSACNRLTRFPSACTKKGCQSQFAPAIIGVWPEGRSEPGMDLSHWFSTRQGVRTGGKLFGFPTWRYRVLRAALRLRPRRALSSASGQKTNVAHVHFIRQKILKKSHCSQLTNHIPALSC